MRLDVHGQHLVYQSSARLAWAGLQTQIQAHTGQGFRIRVVLDVNPTMFQHFLAQRQARPWWSKVNDLGAHGDPHIAVNVIGQR